MLKKCWSYYKRESLNQFISCSNVSFNLSEASALFIYLFFLQPSHNRRIEITMSVHNTLPGVFIQDQLIVSMRQIKCSELLATRESSEDIFWLR